MLGRRLYTVAIRGVRNWELVDTFGIWMICRLIEYLVRPDRELGMTGPNGICYWVSLSFRHALLSNTERQLLAIAQAPGTIHAL